MTLIYQRHRWPLLILFLTFGLYFIFLFARMIFFENGAFYVGHEHAWSDWPLHIAISNIFAYQPPEQWFDHHPMFAHGGLRYTFLTNFISGMLMRAGVPLLWAFAVPSIIFSLVLIVGIYSLFNLILRSRYKAVLVVTLFFLSSGLGFFVFLGKMIEAPSWDALFYPELMYSRAKEYSWHSGNILAGFLVPQRSSLLGFALGVWVLTLFIYARYFLDNLRKSRAVLIVAGLLAGILPLAHMHSFLIIAAVTAALSITALFNNHNVKHIVCMNYKKISLPDVSWLYFAIPATVISVSLYYVFFYSGSELQGFIRFYPFWEAKGSFLGWLWMWFKLWGAVLPLTLIGFFLFRKQELWVRVFYYTFLIVFILSNLFLLQPIPWDNSKIFFWCYLGFLGLVVQVLSKLWEESEQRKYIARFDVMLLIFVLCFTGVLELIRLQRIDKNRFHVTSERNYLLAQDVREHTDNQSVFVTSSYSHHFIMVWTARPILLGFKGWMANFGFDYREREKDIRDIYQGKENIDLLLQKHKVTHVVFGEGDKREYNSNESYFRQHYPVAFKNNGVRIYDVRRGKVTRKR